MRTETNNLRALPLWTALLPLVTFNACYLVAVSLEHLPACIPYLTGCTSVSSTGRIAPESLIFRAGMLPSAAILVLFWHRCATFLRLGGQSTSRLVALRVAGVIAALFLILYAVTLGLREDEYRFLRRIGINGFALSILLTQIIFIVLYRPMRSDSTQAIYRCLIFLCIGLPLLGITAEVAKWAGAPSREVNNVVAWNAFVVLCAYFVVVGRLWEAHGFSSQFEIRSAGRAASPRE